MEHFLTRWLYKFFPEMSEDAVLSLQSHSTTVDYRGKVPVEHLDYDYIEKCKDVRYLEKILRTLR